MIKQIVHADRVEVHRTQLLSFCFDIYESSFVSAYILLLFMRNVKHLYKKNCSFEQFFELVIQSYNP